MLSKTIKSPWTYYYYAKSIPVVGWKIHISSRTIAFEEVLNLVRKYCLENLLSFKHLTTENDLSFANSGASPRESFGKFITIYVGDETSLIKHYLELDKVFINFLGPTILSDSKLRTDSIVHYRYGGLLKSSYFNFIDGIYENTTYEIEGIVFKDKRRPYFYLPDGVTDPFESLKNKKTDKLILNGRYVPVQSLYFSSKGGVYVCDDLLKNEKVCIKECRPWIEENFDGTRDAIYWQFQEFLMMDELSKIRICSQGIDCFKQDGHSFLVMPLLKGLTLRAYVKKSLGTTTLDEKIKLAEKTCEIFEVLQRNNFVHNDFNPNNLFVKEDGSFCLIDLEHVYRKGTECKQGGTLGYSDKKQDGLFSLAMVLYFIFTESDPIIVNDQQHYSESRKIMRWIIDSERIPTFYHELIIKYLDKRKDFFVDKNRLLTNIFNKTNDSLNFGNDRLIESSEFGKTTHPSCLQHGNVGLIHSFGLEAFNRDELQKIYTHVTNTLHLPMSSGFYFGKTGIIFYLTLIAIKLQNDCEYEKLITQFCNIEQESVLIDFFHGIAGTLHCAVILYQKKPNLKLLEFIKRMQRRLLDLANISEDASVCWSLGPIENSEFSNYEGYGFAHGDAGILYSLIKSYAIFSLDEISMVAEIVLNKISFAMKPEGDSFYVPHGPNRKTIWTHWCNGSSGVLLTYIEYKKVFLNNKYDYIVDGLINSITHKIHSKNLCVCHGLSGDLLSLKDYYDSSPNLKLLEKINMIENYILSKSYHDGNFIELNGEKMVSDFGTGLLGVYFALKQ